MIISEKSNYRESGKTVNTFVFLISRLPMGLEIPSWKFSNSPFCVDFFISSWRNLDPDVTKIVHSHSKSYHFCLLLNHALEHEGLLRSTQEHP